VISSMHAVVSVRRISGIYGGLLVFWVFVRCYFLASHCSTRCPIVIRVRKSPSRLPFNGLLARGPVPVAFLEDQGILAVDCPDHLADERCTRAVLDFLATTDVGRLVPAPAKDDAQSEASGWEFRERREIEEESRVEAEELDAGDEEQPLFLPAPSFMRLQKWGRRGAAFICSSALSIVFSFLLFPLLFLWCAAIFLGQAWVEGKGERAVRRRTADGNWVKKARCHSVHWLNASIIKPKKI
jgi:hypothetical protein